MTACRRSLGLVLMLALAACSSLTSYPDDTYYVVRSGDTLHSIAWRYRLDIGDIARWNGLRDPDRIYAGQRLVLRAPTGQSARPAPAPAARPAAPAPIPARAGPLPSFGWPANGPLLSRFGESGQLATGIGIGGRVGQDVLAAASGRVVYVGGGLVDYGQLVIIEHDPNWLTAYGHNRRLLVGHGQTVSRGQKIGEMGIGPRGEPRLHFEIRRNGDPLDPLTLLPVANAY